MPHIKRNFSHNDYRQCLQRQINEVVHLRGVREWADLTPGEQKIIAMTALRAEVVDLHDLYIDWMCINDLFCDIWEGYQKQEQVLSELYDHIIDYLAEEMDCMLDHAFALQYGSGYEDPDARQDRIQRAREVIQYQKENVIPF